MISWSTIGKEACGFAPGTAGVKALSSEGAKAVLANAEA